jgi:hypothetical protein
MAQLTDRREFMTRTGAAALGLACLTELERAVGDDAAPAVKDPPPILTVISGKPCERGKQYGDKFKTDIHAFRDRFFGKFLTPGSTKREKVLGYAGQCAKEIQAYSPIAMEELEGIAEGAGLTVEETVMINCHEELSWHGLLEKIDHCAALAAGPPETSDGNVYVGQSYEWGWPCRWLLWQRPQSEGPSVLAYAAPGLLPSVGLNSAGVALCGTSAGSGGEPRAGIPYYVLSAHMLYQDSLKGAIQEAQRAKHATWCSMVLGDAEGQLANVEVAQPDVAVELYRGHLARHHYGSRKMTQTPEGKEVAHNERTKHLYKLLKGDSGKLNRDRLQAILDDPVVQGGPLLIDMMLFNTSQREAYVRGQAAGGWDKWHTLRFDSK